MKVLIVISALISIACAGIAPIVIIPSASPLLRSVAPDSAIVRSDRFGDHFAYYIAEGQSFQTVSPFLASNVRALDSLDVSYAINPIPFYGASAPQFIFHQPTSEEEQREQQRIKDLLQQQQDQLQQDSDRLREEEEQRVLAIQQLHNDRPNNIFVTVPIQQQPIGIDIPATQPVPIVPNPFEPQPVEVATDSQTVSLENNTDNLGGSAGPIVTDDAVVVEAKKADAGNDEEGAEKVTENTNEAN